MKFRHTMFALALAGLLGSPLSAARKPTTPEQRAEIVEIQVGRLTKKFKLTSDQQTQARSILQDKIDKQEQAIDEANMRLRALLTPEQLKKFNDLTE